MSSSQKLKNKRSMERNISKLLEDKLEHKHFNKKERSEGVQTNK
jgi:hypothetical protein